jgi:hypothetical protein
LIVGGEDTVVIDLNQQAAGQLTVEFARRPAGSGCAPSGTG